MPKRFVGKMEISIPETKRILENIGELNQFQLRTFDYVNKFSKIDALKAEELANRLVEKFDISKKEAIQVVNCMPKSLEELRTFFSLGKKKIIIMSQLEEMLKLLADYR